MSSVLAKGTSAGKELFPQDDKSSVHTNKIMFLGAWELVK